MVAFGEATDSPIEQEEADLLSSLKLSVSVSYDKPLKETKLFKEGCSGAASTSGGSTEGVSIGYALNGKKDGKTYLDVRLVGDKMYAKADVRAIAELGGASEADLADLDQLPPEAAPFKDLIDGKWVSADADAFKRLSRQMAGAGAAYDAEDGGANPGTAPSVDPSVLQHFCDSMKGALSRNVTLSDHGKSGDADVIRVSASASALLDSVYGSISDAAKEIPGAPKLPSKREFEGFGKAPDRRLAADVRIVDGRASAITVDLAQFADDVDWSVHLPLRLGISAADTPIPAPSGATPFDVDKLGELLTSMENSKSYDDEDYYTDDDSYSGPGTPLTESQYAQLEALGIDRETAEAMSEAGLEFDEMKELAPELT
ncbi:hypothetical protein [Kitasatospora sp. NPDC057198]|uniref:hypothetical protein n=1 Tax=Kitasatospora sp. NPDC057198 TaxID=3346046 RepID=UPI0036397E44